MPGVVIFLLDLALAALGIEATAWLVHEYVHHDALIGLREATVASTTALGASAVGCYLVGLHDPSNLVTPRTIIVRSLVVGAFSTSLAFLTAYFYWYLPTGRITIVVQGVGIGLGLTLWRLAYSAFLRRGPRLSVIVLGRDGTAAEFARRLNRLEHTRFRVIGYLADPAAAAGEEPAEDDLPVLGSPSRALELCRQHACRLVVVAQVPTPQQVEAVGHLRTRGIRVTSAAAMTMDVARRLPAELLPDEWVLDVFERFDRSAGTEVIKRILDLTIGSIGLVVFTAMLPLLFVAVKLDSRGPFFFVQERVGLGGDRFRLFKIRTMAHSNPGETTDTWASADDARVTRLGRLLRLTRVDEFPQFLNVVRGEMSIVGPRPEQPRLIAELQARLPTFHYRHLVRPGITGWAQIQHGYAGSIDESVIKLAHDLYYVRNYGIRLDLDIMLRTFFVMAARVGSR